ncbi:MAG: bifunctional diaminohydroxyphosphoribosylaminopyrimidine deaminase/5-amino-6-(5-phosphoribosylamino)uracil reductase RibD [Kiritimatiellae bacterium]|nr:bifunctional diaminohydroxyphosphoribosylaminopyrimidine deaminase/5-amino-6-(5-phosphoribosylamino)uracil reductase RibD [Kiritimatiellia bacterium]
MRRVRGDCEAMLLALDAAKNGEGHTRPNPPVGAVVVKGGRVIGVGWHARCGGDHAEVAALKDAARRGKSVRGASLYVTLEPCSRPGRVGACTDAIAAAKIARVVYAIPDPNPSNRGRAKRVLAKAGIDCSCLRDADATRLAKRLVAPFAKHVTTGMPYVTVKVAMSLDGRICDVMGDAKWISSASARRITGMERLRADAIMVGAETVRRDDPSLLPHEGSNPDLVRVVVSRSGKLPRDARIFTDGAPNRTLVCDDARKALETLGKAGIMHVLCEGGLCLARFLADEGLVDEWISVLSPVAIGSRPVSAPAKFKRAAVANVPDGDVIVRCESLHPSNG